MPNLQNNIASLQELIEKAKALPEAGNGGPDTSDATATAEDIVSPKTAYVDGIKVTGTNPYEKATTDAEISTQVVLLDEILSMLSELPPVGTPLNDMSWEDISEISQSGKASNYFSIGDAKEIIINGQVGQATFDNLSVWAFILGFNHNSAKEGMGIHFQIGKTAQTGGMDICLIDSQYSSPVSSTACYFNMNYANTNSGGWNGSKMRTTLLGNSNTPSSPLSGSLIAALPSDLRAVMKGVTKYSDNTGGGSDTASYVTSTTDYLWLLAEWEVFGTRKYANSAEQNYQAQYAYYANGNSKVKYKHSDTSSAAIWWLRSASATSSSYFCNAISSGSVSHFHANYGRGVAPAFCV